MMSSVEILPLPVRVDADLAADIEKQAAYVLATVGRVRVHAERAAVEIELTAGADAGVAKEKVARFVEAMTKRHRPVARKVVACHARTDRPPLQGGVHEELLRRRWLFDLGRGQMGLAGPALSLARLVDADCARIAAERFGAIEQSYPALIPSSVLARCGYFGSFPHTVSFVAHLSEDFDRIEAFRRANAEGGPLAIPDTRDFAFEACLSPALCYHAYQAHEGRTLESSGATITCAGRCYRYESKNLVGLERLWDFSMREVVFMGTAARVASLRRAAMDAVMDQVERWDLEGFIETANDPFFPTTYSAKRYFQMNADLKFELRLPVEPGDGAPRTIAAASFNVHESFFGQAFTISTAEGDPACTSCVGWGIERWVLALFAQHGFDPSRWPEALRRIF